MDWLLLPITHFSVVVSSSCHSRWTPIALTSALVNFDLDGTRSHWLRLFRYFTSRSKECKSPLARFKIWTELYRIDLLSIVDGRFQPSRQARVPCSGSTLSSDRLWESLQCPEGFSFQQFNAHAAWLVLQLETSEISYVKHLRTLMWIDVDFPSFSSWSSVNQCGEVDCYEANN